MRGRSRSGKRMDMAVFRPLLLLGITVLIDLLGFGIVLPNLPQYVEAAVGRNHQQAAFIGSLLAASYSLTQFLCAPFWGAYSDRVGRRPVILISLLGIAISYALFGLSSGHLWMLFAARLLAGLLSSASIGVSFAYVADVTTDENRAKGMGLLGACFGLGFAFGPVLGGLLGHLWLPLPAFVAAGMALLNFAFSFRSLPESLSPEARERLAQEKRPAPIELMRRVLSDPAAPVFAITFVLTFGFTAIEQILGYFLMARGIASSVNQPIRMAAILGYVGVIGILIQGGMIGTIVKRIGEGSVVRLGLAILIVGYILLTLPTAWGIGIFIASTFISAGRSMIGPAASSLISRKTRVGQGLIQSTSQGFDALARTVGPVTAGTLFDKVSPVAPYYVSAVLTLAALTLTFVIQGAVQIPPSAVETEAMEAQERATAAVAAASASEVPLS